MPNQRPPMRPPNMNNHKKSQSASMRYYQYLEKRPGDKKKVIYEDEEREIKTKGNISALAFEGELSDEENTYIISGAEDEKAIKVISKTKRKMILSAICLAFALLLNFVQFTPPNTPSIVKVDFSAFPELLAAVAVNPLVGIGIVLIKNLLYYFINQNAVASIPNKIILDIVFILITWLVAFALMKTKGYKKYALSRQERGLVPRAYNGSALLIGGLVSSLSTAGLSVFTLKYVLLPLLYRLFGAYGYTPESIFKFYQIAYEGLTGAIPFVLSVVPSMDSLNTGIILYNIPLNFLKYFICAIFATIAYLMLNDVINKEN